MPSPRIWLKESVHKWVETSRDYVVIHVIFCNLDGSAAPPGISNHNLSIGDAVCLGFCDIYLEDEKAARWARMAASSYRTYIRIVNFDGVVHEAWAELLGVFLLQSDNSRTQASLKGMMKMKLADTESP